MSGVWGAAGCASWLIIGLIVGGFAVAALVTHFDGKRHREAIAADLAGRAERGSACPWCGAAEGRANQARWDEMSAA